MIYLCLHVLFINGKKLNLLNIVNIETCSCIPYPLTDMSDFHYLSVSILIPPLITIRVCLSGIALL